MAALPQTPGESSVLLHANPPTLEMIPGSLSQVYHKNEPVSGGTKKERGMGKGGEGERKTDGCPLIFLRVGPPISLEPKAERRDVLVVL